MHIQIQFDGRVWDDTCNNHQSECICFFSGETKDKKCVSFVGCTIQLYWPCLCTIESTSKILSYFTHLYFVYPFQIVLYVCIIWNPRSCQILFVFGGNVTKHCLKTTNLFVYFAHTISLLLHSRCVYYVMSLEFDVIFNKPCHFAWIVLRTILNNWLSLWTNYSNNIHFTKSVYKFYTQTSAHVSARIHYSQNV